MDINKRIIDTPVPIKFETSVVIGNRLIAMTKGVRNWKERDCFKQLQKYLNSDSTDRVCLVFGLRRTGKTTMLRMILGLIHPQEGTALLRGKDGKEAKMNADVRELFSYVPQGNTIFSGTVAENLSMAKKLDPALTVSKDTPQAFIWHTSNDGGVNVINSYRYAEALRRNNINAEMHIFPDGPHGLGLAQKFPHVAQWSTLLKNWFIYLGWLND